MEVIIDKKKRSKAFASIAVGDCFLVDGILWVKAGKVGEQPFAQCIGSTHTLSRDIIHPAREVVLVDTLTASS